MAFLTKNPRVRARNKDTGEASRAVAEATGQSPDGRSEIEAADPHTVPADCGTSAADAEVRSLAYRVQALYRAQATLREMLARNEGAQAKAVTVRLRTGTARDHAATKVARIAPVSDPWWPDPLLPERSLIPPQGHRNFGNRTDPAEVVACSVIGLRGPDLDAAVATMVDWLCGKAGFKPVFLTDSDDLAPFLREGFVAEYVSPADGSCAAPDARGIPPPRLDELRRKWNIGRIVDLRHVKAPPTPVTITGAAPQPDPKPSGRRRKVAVVAWDLGHNPAGRAMVIHDLLARDYDVELIGPIWSRFGSHVWSPIRNSARKVRSFPCDRFEDFWPRAVAIAADAEYDLVVVCKPQLPGLLLGAMIKQSCHCPLVLDIDDFELSFSRDHSPASLDELEAAGPEALCEPYLELAARVCDGLAGDADARTVSNIALHRRFGGYIVRHARNEAGFDPDRFDRAAARAALSIAQEDFAIFFVGTVRRHKGVFELAKTLATHPDRRLALHIVGEIPDRRLRQELERFTETRIRFHPGCPFDKLPERLVAADAVVLLQDPSHPISQYQIPAKVSDAAALGLPIIATDVPPLRDLALQGLVRTIDPRDLARALDGLLAERDDGRAVDARQRQRECFRSELGFGVNRERLLAAIDQASRARPGLPCALERLISIAAEAYRQMRSAVRPTPAPAAVKGQFDIAMFWKQNDSGLYGRRSDMMMKHLLGTGRVRRVLQFDAPMPLSSLAEGASHGPDHPAAHILQNTIDNQFGLRDGDQHLMRTFLWDRRGRATALPNVGTDPVHYPDYVAHHMERSGLRPDTTIAWVCPVVFDFPRVAARIPFRGIVGDLIDDQRLFPARDTYRERIVASYAATVPLFDLTFTNCQPMAEAFRQLAGEIHVVPNGTDPAPEVPGEAPASLRGLTGPVAGYLGNLRDRFDWDLLREVALRLPHVAFPIIGGGARPDDIAKVREVPNVHLLGMVPHARVAACIAVFDVALMPHARTELTHFMNPLKIYAYFAARKPIVATEVDNIDAALKPFIRFAADAGSFAAAIEDALQMPPQTGPRHAQALSGILWDARVRDVLSTLDAWLDRTAR